MGTKKPQNGGLKMAGSQISEISILSPKMSQTDQVLARARQFLQYLVSTAFSHLGELGEIIQETMESHEITLDGITRQINSVTNLTGHSIEAYQIHAGKQVPNCHAPDYNERMEEGEVFAIETFASTGGGYVDHDPDCSHYMIKYNQLDAIPKNISTKGRKLAHVIKNEFSSLPFCRRWIDRLDYAKGETWEGKYLMQLNELVKSRWIRDYPGLSDTAGSFVAQFEHTVMMRPTCKEVVTRGDDY